MAESATRYIVLTRRKPVEVDNPAPDWNELLFILSEIRAGRILSIESRGDTTGALLEVRAESQAEAERYIDTLPGIRAGIEKAIVIPVREYSPLLVLADAVL
jgi:hypothetical protein